VGEARGESIEDPRPAAFRRYDARFAEDAEMMGDGRLGDVAARREIARAGLVLGGELADDRESRRIREGRKEADIGIEGGRPGDAWHGRNISPDFDIDNYRYSGHDGVPSGALEPEPMTTTDPIISDVAITDTVRARYGDAARAVLQRGVLDQSGVTDCCTGTPDGAWGDVLYTAADRASLPETAVLASLGCGNPTAVAELRPGEVVLDLGSGGGIDVLLSATRVGPTGFAYGLDMTDEMLELARRNATDAGATNVEFRKGRIESIPLGDASVDVVISNCVVNLSTDKGAVLAEVARVLRPGGRVGISDVVADDALSPTDRAERGSFVGCIAGALSFAEYRAGLEAVGLTNIDIAPTHAVGDGLHGAIIKATKPDGWTHASIRAVDLPRPVAGQLPILAAGDGCCGSGCGCS
jgi:arsenite methyltransferase